MANRLSENSNGLVETSVEEQNVEKRTKVKRLQEVISSVSRKQSRKITDEKQNIISSALSNESWNSTDKRENIKRRSKVKRLQGDILCTSSKESTNSNNEKNNTAKRTSITKYRIQIYDYKRFNFLKKIFKMITWVVLASAAVLNYMYFSINCMDSLNEASLTTKLSKLFGQENAVASIADALTENTDESKIMYLFGGTGVGKTYTTDLIFGDHWNNTNVYHYTMPSFKKVFNKGSLNGMLVCQKSIVIIDDLSFDDNVHNEVSDIIKAAERISNRVIVILIYNCENVHRGFIKRCENSFLDHLQHQFSSLDVKKYFIKFDSLTEQVLRQCIEEEIKLQQLKHVDIHALMKNFDVTSDGCKGVHNKIKLLYH